MGGIGREGVGVGWAEGVMGRESNGFEGAKRPFGRERSEPSCPGPGSAERSAAERGPNSSYLIFRCTSNQKDMNNKVICNCFGRDHRKSQPNFGYGLPGPREPI